MVYSVPPAPTPPPKKTIEHCISPPHRKQNPRTTTRVACNYVLFLGRTWCLVIKTANLQYKLYIYIGKFYEGLVLKGVFLSKPNSNNKRAVSNKYTLGRYLKRQNLLECSKIKFWNQLFNLKTIWLVFSIFVVIRIVIYWLKCIKFVIQRTINKQKIIFTKFSTKHREKDAK